jgi:hypothetical protein
MIAMKLGKLIERHATELSHGLMEKVLHCEKTREFRRIPREELQTRTFQIYRNLGDWLLNKTEEEIEEKFSHIGHRRHQQNVPLSQVVYALVLTKEHLWDFLRLEGIADTALELLQELELFHLVDQFFDKAIYYVSAGYEAAVVKSKVA